MTFTRGKKRPGVRAFARRQWGPSAPSRNSFQAKHNIRPGGLPTVSFAQTWLRVNSGSLFRSPARKTPWNGRGFFRFRKRLAAVRRPVPGTPLGHTAAVLMDRIRNKDISFAFHTVPIFFARLSDRNHTTGGPFPRAFCRRGRDEKRRFTGPRGNGKFYENLAVRAPRNGPDPDRTHSRVVTPSKNTTKTDATSIRIYIFSYMYSSPKELGTFESRANAVTRRTRLRREITALKPGRPHVRLVHRIRSHGGYVSFFFRSRRNTDLRGLFTEHQSTGTNTTERSVFFASKCHGHVGMNDVGVYGLPRSL